ncbi:MAG: phosphoribosylanthranilate isomerase [Nitrospinae bacterium]|nr:phosphoribosylanthranilate isomerase [Nitrospinota bacterium]
MMVNVKICGITNLEDAEIAINFGADALGFNFVPGTPRFLEVQYAKEIMSSLSYFDQKIGVFADEERNRVEKISSELELKTIQLHGNETPQDCDYFVERGFRIIRALRVRDSSTINVVSEYKNCTILLDSFVRGKLGGTGEKFNWSLAKELTGRESIILSGGLNSSNVREALKEISPFGVDVCSGVEKKNPRKKDPELVKEFINNAKSVLNIG